MSWKYSDKRFLTGTERNQVRAMLRREFKAGRLEWRRTYYDYYDSCHAPTETPDAPWAKLEPDGAKYQSLDVNDFKAGGPAVYALPDGSFELSTHWSQYEVRVKGRGDGQA